MRMEMQMTNRQRMFRHELESSKREVRGMFFRGGPMGGWLRPATRQRVRAVARQMAREAMRRVRKQAAADLGKAALNGN